MEQFAVNTFNYFKHHLKQFFWSHFTSNFDSDSPFSYHLAKMPSAPLVNNIQCLSLSLITYFGHTNQTEEKKTLTNIAAVAISSVGCMCV